MRLLSDWKRLIRKAWSIRLIALAAALEGLSLILPLFIDTFPRNEFAVLTMIVVVAAGVARIVAQPKMDQAEPRSRRLSDKSYRMRHD